MATHTQGSYRELQELFKRFAQGRQGGLVLIIGRPGSGRRALAAQIARALHPDWRELEDGDHSSRVNRRLAALSRWTDHAASSRTLLRVAGPMLREGGAMAQPLARYLLRLGGRGQVSWQHNRPVSLLMLQHPERHPQGMRTLANWLPARGAEPARDWVILCLEAGQDDRSLLEGAIPGARYPDDKAGEILVLRTTPDWNIAALERQISARLGPGLVQPEVTNAVYAALEPWAGGSPSLAGPLLDEWRRRDIITLRMNTWSLSRRVSLWQRISPRARLPGVLEWVASLAPTPEEGRLLSLAAWGGPVVPWEGLLTAIGHDPERDGDRGLFNKESLHRLWRIQGEALIWRDDAARELVFRVAQEGSVVGREALRAAALRARGWLRKRSLAEQARWAQAERMWTEAGQLDPVSIPELPRGHRTGELEALLTWVRFGPPVPEGELGGLVDRLESTLAIRGQHELRELLWRAVLERYGNPLALHRARAAHRLGMVAQHQGRLAEAEAWYRQCQDMVTTPDRPLAERASTQHGLAEVLFKRRRYNDAEASFRRALLDGDRGSLAALDLALIRHGLARALLYQGRSNDAEVLLWRIPDELAATGASPSALATARHDLARVWWMQGRTAKAIHLLEVAWTYARSEGAGPDEAARMTADLGHWYMETGNIAEAERVLRVAVSMGGPTDDPGRVPMLLGRVYIRQGRFAEAETILREAIRLRHATGMKEADVLQPRMDLAVAIRQQGRVREAELLLRRWLSNADEWAGPAESSRLHHQLALAVLHQNDVDEAERQFRTALDYGVQAELSSGSVAAIRQGLGALLLRQGNTSEAASEIRRALSEMRASAHGSNEAALFRTLSPHDRIRFQEADQLLRTAMEEFEAAGAHASHRALTRQLMAQLAKEQGRDAEARELALKAEADLVGYLEQLRAGDNMDPRLKPVYAALRDNARLRGDEQEVEFWKNELSMMAHIGGPVLVNISATTS